MTAARALVVDDDPVSRMHAVNVLTKLGWHASGLSKPGAALDAVKMFGDVRLVLVDWQLLPQDPPGIEVIRSLRGLTGQPPLCLLLYTGKADRDEKKRALESGANGVVEKPLEREALGRQLLALGLSPDLGDRPAG